MNNVTNSLTQLRDIHLPAPISWWPLAPGWYVLIAVILILILGLIYGYYRWRRKCKNKIIAMEQLQQLQQRYQQQGDALATVQALSTLLRRSALATFPRHEIAGLQGQAWLLFLDHSGNTNAFTQGVGKVLITAPYQAQINTDITELFSLIETWMRRNLA